MLGNYVLGSFPLGDIGRYTNIVTSDIVASYNIRNVINSSVIAQYNLLNLVQSFHQGSYDIRQRVNSSIQNIYDILDIIRATSSLQSLYYISNYQVSDLTIPYDIRKVVNSNIANPYAIRLLSSPAELEGNYFITGRVNRDIEFRYPITRLTISDNESKYTIKNIVNSDRQFIYNLKNNAQSNLQALFHILSFDDTGFRAAILTGGNFSFAYNIWTDYTILSSSDSMTGYEIDNIKLWRQPKKIWRCANHITTANIILDVNNIYQQTNKIRYVMFNNCNFKWIKVEGSNDSQFNPIPYQDYCQITYNPANGKYSAIMELNNFNYRYMRINAFNSGLLKGHQTVSIGSVVFPLDIVSLDSNPDFGSYTTTCKTFSKTVQSESGFEERIKLSDYRRAIIKMSFSLYRRDKMNSLTRIIDNTTPFIFFENIADKTSQSYIVRKNSNITTHWIYPQYNQIVDFELEELA